MSRHLPIGISILKQTLSSDAYMKNVVVTNSNSTSALAIIRSLGRRKIPIIASDSVVYSIGFMSKYCSQHILYEDPIQHPRESLATLVKIGEAFDKPILLPAGDDIIFLAMKYREIFERAFVLPLPLNESLKYAIDKELTIRLALREKVPIPKTFAPLTVDELKHLKDRLEYPLVIKPRINVGFRRRFRTKLFKVWSFEQLTQTYKLVSKYFPKPLIQEYIPGETDTLYSFCTIFDQRHRPLGIFSIRKLHQLVEGVTACGEFVDDQEIANFAVKILRSINWVGPAEVEFKRDSRNGALKLMEINPRPFMWMALPITSGLDIPYLWYKIAMGESCKQINAITKGLKFINLFHYLLGFIRELSSDKGATKFLRSHVTPLKGGHFVYDLSSKEDPGPFLSYPLLLVLLRIREACEQKKLQLNILQN